MTGLNLTFLGTGTSTGVPMIACDCEVCRSEDPRDTRFRCSVYVETPDAKLLVDCGPDLRQQCLGAGIDDLDAVLITHPHVDHIVGFDDLRRFTVGMEEELEIYARPSCLAVLEQMFFYLFNGENRYPGYFKPDTRAVEGPFTVGDVEIVPIDVSHGKVECIGYLFRLGGRSVLGYLPDAKTISPEGKAALGGVDCLVLDGLRHQPHPTHMNIEEALATISELAPGQAWLTHIAHQVMHAELEAELPEGVRVAYDELQLKL